MNVISFAAVTKSYGKIEVLKGIDFTVRQGFFVVIVGPSGCGKSTLLRIIAGLEKETTGMVSVSDNPSMVFQNSTLLPWRDVSGNIMLGVESKRDVSDSNKNLLVEQSIELMGLTQYTSHFPRELSGGQRQRVGIARAIVGDPSIILFDEPFSALDAETTENLHREILDIWSKKQLTIIMVSHSLDEAIELADIIYVMKDGVIVHKECIGMDRPRNNKDVHTESIKAKLKSFF
jgi:sulfonate transport system ATP-binding protein